MPGFRLETNRLEDISHFGKSQNRQATGPSGPEMTGMPDDKAHQLLISAIGYLKIQYAEEQAACLALLIARHYRLLAEASAENNKQINYINQSSTWFCCYLKNREHELKPDLNIRHGDTAIHRLIKNRPIHEQETLLP